MLQHFTGTLRSKRRFFFASPLHITGSFSCRHSLGISGRGQALQNGLLRYHAKLAGEPWRVIQKKFFGPKSPRSRGRKTLSCVSTKHEQLEQLHFCLCPEDRVKKRSSSGVVFIFVDLRSRNFSLDGGDVDQKLRIRLLSINICPWAQCNGGACKTARAKHGSAFL